MARMKEKKTEENGMREGMERREMIRSGLKKFIFPEKDDSFQPFMPGLALVIRSLSTPTEANADKYLVFGIHTLATDFRDDRLAVPPQSSHLHAQKTESLCLIAY